MNYIEKVDMYEKNVDKQVEAKLRESFPELIKQLYDARCLSHFFMALNKLDSDDFVNNSPKMQTELAAAFDKFIHFQPYCVSYQSRGEGLAVYMYYDSMLRMCSSPKCPEREYAVELVIPATAHNWKIGRQGDSAGTFLLNWLITTLKPEEVEMKIFGEHRYGYKAMLKVVA